MARLFVLALMACVVGYVMAVNYNMVQPRNRAMFDGLTCSTCEGVMNIVSKQLPLEEAGKVGKEGLKLAVKVSLINRNVMN